MLISKIAGLPIMTFDEGKKISSIHDVVFNEDSNMILGFIIDNKKMLSFESIKSLGEDAVIVNNDEVIASLQDVGLEVPVEKQNAVKNKKMMTEDGKDLGTVDDLAINPVSGKVTGYVVSGGMFKDMYEGKPYVTAPQTIKVGEDVIFVPSGTEQMMSEQSGGLKKVIEDTQAGAVTLAGQATDKAKELSDTAKEKTQELYTNAKEKIESPEVQDKVSEFKEKAQDAWDKTKEGAKDMAEKAKTSIADTAQEANKATADQALDKTHSINTVDMSQVDTIIVTGQEVKRTNI